MTTSHKISEGLASRIHRGDLSAEAEFVQTYSPGITIVLRQRCNDPLLVEDLCQDALRIVLERLRREPLDNPSQVNAFVCATARNLLTADLRKKSRQKTVYDSNTIDSVADPSQDPSREIGRLQVGRIVQQLIGEMRSERDRILLDRFYIREHDKDDICADLNLTRRHFDRVLFRARKRFRELLMRSDSLTSEESVG